MNLETIDNRTADESITSSLEYLNNQIVTLNCGHQVRCSEILIKEVMTQTGIELRVTCPRCGL